MLPSRLAEPAKTRKSLPLSEQESQAGRVPILSRTQATTLAMVFYKGFFNLQPITARTQCPDEPRLQFFTTILFSDDKHIRTLRLLSATIFVDYVFRSRHTNDKSIGRKSFPVPGGCEHLCRLRKEPFCSTPESNDYLGSARESDDYRGSSCDVLGVSDWQRPSDL